ncbi:Helix-turn-helix domain protein [Gemmata obscuriglobus]|nr:Helix-turn-helix domain protein [Gemmata obscuriglobus]VTS05212.1 ---NA--- : : HTH_17 [Gemmata obscuriglobus UQM 2246]
MHSVKTAAKELGVSPSLIYRLCNAGKLKHERFGLGRGTIRIAPEAITEYRQRSSVPQIDRTWATRRSQSKHLKL